MKKITVTAANTHPMVALVAAIKEARIIIAWLGSSVCMWSSSVYIIVT